MAIGPGTLLSIDGVDVTLSTASGPEITVPDIGCVSTNSTAKIFIPGIPVVGKYKFTGIFSAAEAAALMALLEIEELECTVLYSNGDACDFTGYLSRFEPGETAAEGTDCVTYDGEIQLQSLPVYTAD